ncbi:MAG: hypothetical protein J6T51_01820 [Kiritimatiellae bacterium]|nr:hypothetical protein [Kiritimatiellia bacterium]
MPQVNVNLATFRHVANQAKVFSSRDIVVEGSGRTSSVRLGNLVFSHSKDVNRATMEAFKDALEREYGVFGTHAFDTAVGSRAMSRKSLRACDVKAALSNLEGLKEMRFKNELDRQLNTNPKFRELPANVRETIAGEIKDAPLKGCDLASCKKPADMARQAARRIEKAIADKVDWARDKTTALKGRELLETDAKPNEPTGLRNLKVAFDKFDSSSEDQVKKGKMGAGMLMNRSATNPVLLEKLKTNGVEPGFIYRNDWSLDDTRGMMADVNSKASLDALEAMKEDEAFAEQCAGLSLQRQIMLAGRAHPAAMAAVSEWVIQEALNIPVEQLDGSHPFAALGKAIRNHFNGNEPDQIKHDVSNHRYREIVNEIKKECFVEIRDAVMSIDDKSDFYEFSPVFRHFSERSIMKLDYNENDRLFTGGAASSGSFRRPERILASRSAIGGPIYRFTSRQSADKISSGAVTEALANDLTRLAGVPSQELQIVRGKYSDGHPKIMLSAKFAKGYKDMEDGMLRDGRAVPPTAKDGTKGPDPESLGKYKAFFLLTADRDGVGKRGQNKGFINGKFFAIDPGHSLEGNGKYLDISDDFSFRDTYGSSSKPRFNNFSVFDDDTRFAKLSGLIELRTIARSGAFEKLFADYKAAFNPEEQGIPPDEKALRTKICAEIDEKKAEFDLQLGRLMRIFGMQLDLFDRLSADGPAMQEGAVNTLSHLEMLTSPTTWVSKHGEVALKHLEVRPETRVPWRAGVDGDNIVYHCDKHLSAETHSLLATMAQGAGATIETDALGVTRLTVPKGAAERFFAALSEENVQKLTHPEEYVVRKEGGDPLKVARDFKPVPYVKVPDPRPRLTAEQLPDALDVEVDGVVVQYPKIHYEKLATTASPISRPRTVEQLKAFLEARVRRGLEILSVVRDGDLNRFEPSHDNMIALTHALHHLALRKGQYMYRGAFSIADPDGNLARWLDGSPDLYARASTHATPYHSMIVDGHRNEARGWDAKSDGMDGMLNGMRTFHFFTIPDADHLQDAGGSGQRRRLYLKCETYGVFVNKISSENAKASLTSDMKQREYKFGDLIESIAHGMSLFGSKFTAKERPGIHKENLLERQKAVIAEAERKLVGAGLHRISERMLANGVRDGAGIRMLVDNLGEIYDRHMPEDPAQRLRAAEILDEMMNDLEEVSANMPGPSMQRIGNEIMIG